MRSFWSTYRAALTSSGFIFAALTLALTLISWGLHLAGAPDAAVTVTGVAAALVGGAPIALGAAKGLVARELNVDELVTIAIVASIVVGEYWGASLVAFMMLFGKVLEDVTAARAEAAIEGLGQLVPSTAHVRGAGGGEREVPVEDVRLGDVVVVRPGERIPVDGDVVAGQAAVEEAAITGESLPAEKQPGSPVYAGTLASGGALEVRATRTGEATALGRIAALVKEAESERAPIVRMADRWARWFTPSVLLLAALVFVWQRHYLPALTVLVVACPCALVLATPTAILAGIARGARSGILVKGGARLEAAGGVDAVCFDKTGTLTLGRPALRRLVPLPEAGVDGDTALALAAAAERLSEHPLGRAVVAAAH
ncbi:MAG TPA: HAD-IC family P-type ATPase, partial [Chloroflexota bacterium]|nr:HAD-IC family P-type ATPase [Chloroflexota bacterium]